MAGYKYKGSTDMELLKEDDALKAKKRSPSLWDRMTEPTGTFSRNPVEKANAERKRDEALKRRKMTRDKRTK